MERKYAERWKKSFHQTILDTPVPKLSYSKKSKRIKALPPLLVPTKYVAPQPKPKPRTQKSRPVPLPRYIPKKVDEKVKKVIDEITPYYRPEAIIKFNKALRDEKNLRVRIKEKARALKNHAKSFEVAIISKKDAVQKLYNTRTDVARVLEGELSIDRGIKVEVTLKVLMKKKKKM